MAGEQHVKADPRGRAPPVARPPRIPTSSRIGARRARHQVIRFAFHHLGLASLGYRTGVTSRSSPHLAGGVTRHPACACCQHLQGSRHSVAFSAESRGQPAKREAVRHRRDALARAPDAPAGPEPRPPAGCVARLAGRCSIVTTVGMGSTAARLQGGTDATRYGNFRCRSQENLLTIISPRIL